MPLGNAYSGHTLSMSTCWLRELSTLTVSMVSCKSISRRLFSVRSSRACITLPACNLESSERRDLRMRGRGRSSYRLPPPRPAAPCRWHPPNCDKSTVNVTAAAAAAAAAATAAAAPVSHFACWDGALRRYSPGLKVACAAEVNIQRMRFADEKGDVSGG
jgi:hypothetical protein